MHFDHSKIFVIKFALKFTEFQKFQPSAKPSAFGCIDLWQPKVKLKVGNLRPLVDRCIEGNKGHLLPAYKNTLTSQSLL